MSSPVDVEGSTGPGGGATGGARRWLPVLLAVLLLVVVVLAIGPTRTGLPLDPDSPGDDGLLGLVWTLEALGVEVAVSTRPPEDQRARAFVPLDRLSETRRDEWRTWVQAGGTLVVADPLSRFHDREVVAPAFGELLAPAEIEPLCDLLPEDVAAVLHDDWTGYATDDAATSSCFPLDDAAWLVAVEQGQGQLILLGSPRPFTNRWLGEVDNAVLAAALLGPTAQERVVIVPRPPPDEVEVTLLDLVPDGVWRGVLLAAIAAVVAVIALARRLGPPVEEQLPPVVPSAELATSIGDLTRRAGDRDGAAARLRSRAREVAARSLGLARETDAARLAARAAHHLHLDPEVAERALVDAPVGDDEELLTVASSVARLLDALAVPAPPAPTTSAQAAEGD